MKLKILDLFSGLGGFSLGLERTGNFETVAFCEIDKFCTLILQKHWKGVKIYNDVKEITKEKLIADGIQLPDIITGGFPCQPFSVAGKQKGTSDDRHLWPEMFRIIKEFTPRWVIGENVKGITNIQDGMVFETVCANLEGEGYEVETFNIPAASVGAPHRRERIWIIASLENARRTLRPGTELREKNEDEIRKEDANQHQRSGSPSESDVADTNSGRSDEPNNEIQTGRNIISPSSEDVANTESSPRHDHEAVAGNGGSSTQEVSGNGSSVRGESAWWDFEPDVGRVAHGVPGRVYRLKALGNSIVPKIAQEIGNAIIKAEGEK